VDQEPWRMTLLMFAKTRVRVPVIGPDGQRRQRTAEEIAIEHVAAICKAILSGKRPVLAVMESNDRFITLIASAYDPIPAMNPDGTRMNLGDLARMKIIRQKQRAIRTYYEQLKGR